MIIIMDKKKNEKKICVPEAEYQMFRRDQKTKKDIKRLVLEMFDKVKNWK